MTCSVGKRIYLWSIFEQTGWERGKKYLRMSYIDGPEGVASRPGLDAEAADHLLATVQDALRLHGQRHPVPQRQARKLHRVHRALHASMMLAHATFCP